MYATFITATDCSAHLLAEALSHVEFISGAPEIAQTVEGGLLWRVPVSRGPLTFEEKAAALRG